MLSRNFHGGLEQAIVKSEPFWTKNMQKKTFQNCLWFFSLSIANFGTDSKQCEDIQDERVREVPNLFSVIAAEYRQQILNFSENSFNLYVLKIS